LIHPIAETRALNCNEAVSHKLPCVEPQIRVCDSHTSRKSALFRVRANLEPLSGPLQPGIRFLRVLLPASPTACLAAHLPRVQNSWRRIGLTTFPFLPTRCRWACPCSARLFPGSVVTTYSQT
jgi:hypothetical protein